MAFTRVRFGWLETADPSDDRWLAVGPEVWQLWAGRWLFGSGANRGGNHIHIRDYDRITRCISIFVLLFNAHPEDRVFTLPRRRFGAQWALELSTADPEAEAGSERHGARTEVRVTARSVVVHRCDNDY